MMKTTPVVDDSGTDTTMKLLAFDSVCDQRTTGGADGPAISDGPSVGGGVGTPVLGWKLLAMVTFSVGEYGSGGGGGMAVPYPFTFVGR